MNFPHWPLGKQHTTAAEPPAAPASSPKSGPAEIGVVFDIDELGGEFYGWAAYQIFFRNLDPKRLTACTLLAGDTGPKLAGRARQYCIAVRALDAARISYIKETLSQRGDKGLLAVEKRFLERSVTRRHPLAVAGEIDAAGNLVVPKDSALGPGWVRGTGWAIVER